MKTLNEVVDLVDMTRRVIQEYEKAGLAKLLLQPINMAISNMMNPL